MNNLLNNLLLDNMYVLAERNWRFNFHDLVRKVMIVGMPGTGKTLAVNKATSVLRGASSVQFFRDFSHLSQMSRYDVMLVHWRNNFACNCPCKDWCKLPQLILGQCNGRRCSRWLLVVPPKGGSKHLTVTSCNLSSGMWQCSRICCSNMAGLLFLLLHFSLWRYDDLRAFHHFHLEAPVQPSQKF